MIRTGALAQLRFPVERSLGRRFPESLPSFRNDFQRDRDRIVHSRAFRRLEAKTQVFPAGISDHFRNRLTHTLEVAQLARTAARVLGVDEDLTEALALAHDIGHPPFAHSGEAALNQILARFGERFEHNVHALRIVEAFEHRYAMYPGLNLCFEVREGIVKHSRDLPQGYAGPLEEYLPGLRPPIEAQLIDLVDEIAYNTADVDDAHEAGFFQLSELTAAVPMAASILEEVETNFPASEERIHLHEMQRRLIDHLMRGLMEGTIGACTAAGVADVDSVRAWPERLVRFTAEAAETSAAMKKFLHARVYHTEILVEERDQSAKAIQRLFEYLLENPTQVPGDEGEGSLPRRITDYIASMTDSYFRRVYAQLLPQFTPSLRS
ncbi:MAG: dNTP triphosphohydrolase [Acidobacteria bacterium]|nr:dNTP triphosphohydrolase [Acidobacteriota bacterium]